MERIQTISIWRWCDSTLEIDKTIFLKAFFASRNNKKNSAMVWMQDTESTGQTNCFPIHQQSTYRAHGYHPIHNSLKGNKIAKNKGNQGGDGLLTWKL